MEFVIKKGDTVADLKQKVFGLKRVKPARQSFFYGLLPLEDDNLPLDELLKIGFGNTLDVHFPRAGEHDIEAQSDCWIVLGPSHKTFETVRMQAGDTKTLTLSKGKLGIVTQKREDQEGKPVLIVDRYR